jgi:hypothetical protein
MERFLPKYELDFFPCEREIKALFGLRSSLVFIKWHLLKKITKKLVGIGALRPFELRLKPTLKPMAYMRDGGDIYISLGLLLTRSPWVTLSVYLHELSHLLISETDNYGALKELQRSFKDSFSSSPLCEAVSPIELYANSVTLSLLNFLCKMLSGVKKRRLFNLISDREERISFAISKARELSV